MGVKTVIKTVEFPQLQFLLGILGVRCLCGDVREEHSMTHSCESSRAGGCRGRRELYSQVTWRTRIAICVSPKDLVLCGHTLCTSQPASKTTTTMIQSEEAPF